jgi:hypothetical protein
MYEGNQWLLPTLSLPFIGAVRGSKFLLPLYCCYELVTMLYLFELTNCTCADLYEAQPAIYAYAMEILHSLIWEKH